jgi:O-antigen ligase
MLNTLIQNNPVLDILIETDMYIRNGIFRASSTFVTPLAFGEFEMIIVPIALFFALYRESPLDKCLGWMAVLGGIVGIYASGSRGAYLGFLLSTAVLMFAWPIRKARMSRGSLAPPLVGTACVIACAVAVVLIIFWPFAHNHVLGGGAQASSTEARRLQWLAGWPLIQKNPITGNGFNTGGFDIGSSIDSYVLSLLVETGVPGLVFFAGILFLSIWFGVREFIVDLSESGALAGSLAFSLVAFTTYRLALSQRENHTLMFSLVAMLAVIIYRYQSRLVNRYGFGPQHRPYSRVD